MTVVTGTVGVTVVTGTAGVVVVTGTAAVVGVVVTTVALVVMMDGATAIGSLYTYDVDGVTTGTWTVVLLATGAVELITVVYLTMVEPGYSAD